MARRAYIFTIKSSIYNINSLFGQDSIPSCFNYKRSPKKGKVCSNQVTPLMATCKQSLALDQEVDFPDDELRIQDWRKMGLSSLS